MMALLLDTNILVRAMDLQSPVSGPCREVMAPQVVRRNNLFLCAQVVIEFWAVATRSRSANGLALSVEEADSFLDQVLAIIPCLDEPNDVAARWRVTVRAHRVTGKSVHDARLVAVMDACQISQIVTFNAGDFRRYGHITCLQPQDISNA